MCGMTTTYVYEDAEGNRQLVTAEGFDVNSEGILFWAQKNPGIRSRQNIRFVAFTGMFRPDVGVAEAETPAQANPAPNPW